MENFYKIQQYLLDKMTEEERVLFEAEVKKNQDLAMELEIQRFELETIDQIKEDALRKRAVKLRVDRKTKKSKVVPLQSKKYSRYWFMLSAAASIALLVGFFFFQNDNLSTSEIISIGYKTTRVDFDGNLKGRGDNGKPLFDSKYIDILDEKNKENADIAITYFTNFSYENETENQQRTLNLGHAFLLANQYKNAISTFESIENNVYTNRNQKEQASFFKAMAMIGNNEKEKAISVLQKLQMEGQNYDVAAKVILEQMP